MVCPSVPSVASRSRLGVCAASSSVGPLGTVGNPPSPSRTRSTILVSACCASWRIISKFAIQASVDANSLKKKVGRGLIRRYLFFLNQYRFVARRGALSINSHLRVFVEQMHIIHIDGNFHLIAYTSCCARIDARNVILFPVMRYSKTSLPINSATSTFASTNDWLTPGGE